MPRKCLKTQQETGETQHWGETVLICSTSLTFLFNIVSWDIRMMSYCDGLLMLYRVTQYNPPYAGCKPPNVRCVRVFCWLGLRLHNSVKSCLHMSQHNMFTIRSSDPFSLDHAYPEWMTNQRPVVGPHFEAQETCWIHPNPINFKPHTVICFRRVIISCLVVWISEELMI